MAFSFDRNVIVLLLTVTQQGCLITATSSTPTPISNSSNQLIENESHDPFKDICKYHWGEYYREYQLNTVCCGNDTLKVPDVLDHRSGSNEVYAECSKEFKKDDASDFPTALWKAFLCKLKKSKAFKEISKITFDELLAFLTKLYPDKNKDELKKSTTKCKAIDSEKAENHMKIQKYMECFFEAENAACHKPFGEAENHDGDVKKTKELGCPVVPGLKFASSIEYCCKKRSTPYEITSFPGTMWPLKTWDDIQSCKDSFAKREMELMPETSTPNPGVATSPNPNDEGLDHQVHTSWDVLCHFACEVEQKNYTKEMLKLDPDRVIDFYTHDFGKTMSDSLSGIIKRRKTKEKIFVGMETVAENSKPMDFAELSAKFSKASEIDQIHYFCKFVDIIQFEERRALHEYCFDEKYGAEWGTTHNPFFVPEH